MADQSSNAHEPGEAMVGPVVVVGAGDASAVLPGAAEHRVDDAADAVLLLGRLLRDGTAARAVVLSLSAMRPEDLAVVRTVRRYFPSAEVWVSDVGPHAAMLAEAVSLGAAGLVADGRLHRFALPAPAPPPRPAVKQTPAKPAAPPDPDPGQPLLSGDELRALLGDPDD